MRSAIWEAERVGAEEEGSEEEEEEGGGGGEEKSRAAMSDSVKDESPHLRMTLEAAGGLLLLLLEEERLEGESDLKKKKTKEVSLRGSNKRLERDASKPKPRTHSDPPPEGLPGRPPPPTFFFPPEEPPPPAFANRALRADTFLAISSADCPFGAGGKKSERKKSSGFRKPAKETTKWEGGSSSELTARSDRHLSSRHDVIRSRFLPTKHGVQSSFRDRSRFSSEWFSGLDR